MKSAFNTNLLLCAWNPVFCPDGQRYNLTEPLLYQSSIAGAITVPAGFITDFASIPRAAWSILDPEDPVILYPSVVHDYLYSEGYKLGTRERADRVLREAMEVCGAAAWQRESVYRAVRWFGASRWAA